MLGSVFVPDCTASYMGLEKSLVLLVFTVCRLYPSKGATSPEEEPGGAVGPGKPGALNSTLVPWRKVTLCEDVNVGRRANLPL